jgi:glycosyltransferase involved in cell wall biosynthesis
VGTAVRFLGAVFAERRDLYATADLYLCPTERASFGVTLLEAMACGTPLVLRDNPGFRAVVQEGREAVFVPGRDTAAWADTVIGLVEDVDRRRTMGEAGLACAARFAWPVVARRELDVYERVTG